LPGQHARGPRPPPPLARPALARSLTQTGPLGALRKSARARARESKESKSRETSELYMSYWSWSCSAATAASMRTYADVCSLYAYVC
jgi:hypothetical protein